MTGTVEIIIALNNIVIYHNHPSTFMHNHECQKSLQENYFGPLNVPHLENISTEIKVLKYLTKVDF